MSTPAEGHEAPFLITAGDSVNYINAHGFQTGYFVRWNKNGAAVIKRPAGGTVTLDSSKLRPCNDGRMIKKRGYIEYRPAHHDAQTKPSKTKRKK